MTQFNYTKPTAIKIRIRHMTDQYPDLSFLDQFEGSDDADEQRYYAEDQNRKADYGNTWYMIGVQADIDFLMLTDGMDSKGRHSYICQTLHSGGIFGYESDMSKEEFASVDAEQLEEAKEYAKVLGIEIPENLVPEVVEE